MDAAGCGDTSSSPDNCGACGHSCLGGSCSSGTCVPQPLWLVGPGEYCEAGHVFVDPQGWVYFGPCYVASHRSIFRCSRGNCSSPTAIVSSSTLGAFTLIPGGIAYSDGNSLVRWNANGSGTTSIQTTASIDALTADATQTVYFMNRVVQGDVDSGIKVFGTYYSCSLFACGAIVGPIGSPTGALLGVDGGLVYAASAGVVEYDAGSGASTVLDSNHSPSAIAADDASVYYAVSIGVWKSMLDLTGSYLLPGSGLSSYIDPGGVAVDDTNVYFGDWTTNAIWKVAKTGGPAVRVAASGLSSFTVDSQALYYLVQGGVEWVAK